MDGDPPFVTVGNCFCQSIVNESGELAIFWREPTSAVALCLSLGAGSMSCGLRPACFAAELFWIPRRKMPVHGSEISLSIHRDRMLRRAKLFCAGGACAERKLITDDQATF